MVNNWEMGKWFIYWVTTGDVYLAYKPWKLLVIVTLKFTPLTLSVSKIQIMFVILILLYTANKSQYLMHTSHGLVISNLISLLYMIYDPGLLGILQFQYCTLQVALYNSLFILGVILYHPHRTIWIKRFQAYYSVNRCITIYIIIMSPRKKFVKRSRIQLMSPMSNVLLSAPLSKDTDIK
jgi:hypothetical protein